MHFLVSILKIRILLFLKLFGTFFMKFLCYVELLGSLTNLFVNSGGKWVNHPNPPYPPTPPIAKFQLSILLSKRLHTKILAKWVSRFPVGTTKKEIYFCTSWVKNTVLNLSTGNEFMFWQICLSPA